MDSDINKTTVLKSYIYLDELEINSLYSQLYPNIIQSTIAYEIKENSHLKASIDGGIAKILSASGSTALTNGTSYTNEVQTNVSIEYKANVVIQHICGNKLLTIGDIIKELDINGPISRKCIIVGYNRFLLTSIYDSNEKFVELSTLGNNFNKTNSTFILEAGNRQNLKDLCMDFLENSEYGLEMHIGGNKMRREVRHLTNHVKNNKMFDLSVLGQISYAGMKQYSIKPFAIW